MAKSDAYEEGYDAFNKGCTLDDNPHDQDPVRQSAWIEGWEDAKIDGELKTRKVCSDK
jgi:ribosome modulation factor